MKYHEENITQSNAAYGKCVRAYMDIYNLLHATITLASTTLIENGLTHTLVLINRQLCNNNDSTAGKKTTTRSILVTEYVYMSQTALPNYIS